MWEAVAGAVGGAILGGVTGDWASERGASRDYDYSLKKEDALYARAQERGLTPQEYYGSNAPGSANVSGSGQVLGNSLNTGIAAGTQAAMQAREKEKDRENAKEIAEIQAGATMRGQDTQAQIAANQLALENRKFTEIALRESASKLNLQEQQIAIAVNEVTTSSPKWEMMMKNLTMGPDNMWVQSYIEHTGINPITDPESFKKLPKEERKKFLLGFLAYGSATQKEMMGISSLLGITETTGETRDKPPLLGAGNPSTGAKPNWETTHKNPFFTIRKNTNY